MTMGLSALFRRKQRVLVVISYYDQRDREPMRNLFSAMQRFEAGYPHDTCLVVNRDTSGPLTLDISLPGLVVLERANAGGG